MHHRKSVIRNWAEGMAELATQFLVLGLKVGHRMGAQDLDPQSCSGVHDHAFKACIVESQCNGGENGVRWEHLVENRIIGRLASTSREQKLFHVI
jgi:hypothetical protein